MSDSFADSENKKCFVFILPPFPNLKGLSDIKTITLPILEEVMKIWLPGQTALLTTGFSVYEKVTQ